MTKKIVALVLSALMYLGTVNVYADEDNMIASATFVDVTAEHDAYEAVEYLYEQGIISGKTSSEFFPDDYLKREEFAKVAALAFKLDSSAKDTVFNDVLAGKWYSDYVLQAGGAGFMEGIGNGNFGIGMTITRQDVAVALYRFLSNQYPGLSANSVVVYVDNADIAGYAREAVSVLGSQGVLTETSDHRICPKDSITRADMAKAVYKAILLQREAINNSGRFGPQAQYDGPYDVPTDDKIAKAMPEIFDPTKYKRQVIYVEDFEKDSRPSNITTSFLSGEIVKEKGRGYNGSDGYLKVEGSMEKMTRGTLSCTTDQLKAGDYVFVSCYYRSENIENVSGPGYGGYLELRDDKQKYLGEWDPERPKKTVSDWTYWYAIAKIPEEANALTHSEFYTVNYGGRFYVGTTGTLYMDEIRLEKIVMEPMDCVMVTPNYKGYIYGDEGIGDINIRSYISSYNGFYDISNFKLVSQVTDAEDKVYLSSETERVSPVTDVYFSSQSLPVGKDYYVSSTLIDKTTGEVLIKREQTIRKRAADYRPKIYLDKYGRIIRNGEPFFALTAQACTIANHECYTEHFNIGSQGWYWMYNDQDHEELAFPYEREGLPLILVPGGNLYVGSPNSAFKDRLKEQKDVRGLLTKIVNNWGIIDNMFMYYLVDEIDPNVEGELTRWKTEIVNDLDPDHFTTGCVDKTHSGRPGVWANTTEILGCDPYPITGKENQNIKYVYDFLTDIKRLTPNKAIYPILQGFGYYSRGDLRCPTQQEFRNMAFQSLCAGACMMDTYGTGYNKRVANKGEDYDAISESYFDVYDEIKNVVSPIYLSVEPAPYYKFAGGGDWLLSMARRYEGKSYVFAVSTANTDKKVKMHLDGVKKARGMYSGEEYTADEDGWFEVPLEKYAVEIFEYDQADYKSPQAELERFMLTREDGGLTLLEAESELPVFYVPQNTSEVLYAADISDYGDLYINGVKMEKTKGKIDISGFTEIVVKVVSQDGRFSSENKFALERMGNTVEK